MNSRSFTNIIRYLMDEWLPPAIRDSKILMYPLYYYAYRGKNLQTIMSLKSNFFKWDKKTISDFYSNRNTRFSNNRITDLSIQNINYIFNKISFSKGSTLLDVGCGNGYFLKLASEKGFSTTGCDIIPQKKFDHSNYIKCDITKLPFEDDSFDIVICSHTLEHVIDFNTSINELKRVAKKKICIVVPCQRPYYYTIDEHIRFFPYKWMLEQEMKMKFYDCKKIHGDLVFIADILKEKNVN